MQYEIIQAPRESKQITDPSIDPQNAQRSAAIMLTEDRTSQNDLLFKSFMKCIFKNLEAL